MNDLLQLFHTPAFQVAAVATIAAAVYSYAYLPLRMRLAYRQSLLTLARAVEAKDLKAAGHGERVAEYAIGIAKQMNLPAKMLRRMEYAAFLQDIGNVRVPYAILNKPGRLTKNEMKRLQTHTEVGTEIVEQVEFLKDISPMIRHHHEAWDGSGYPDGLGGDEIPLGARILAVATAFDSMSSERSYHSPMDEENAVRELKAGAGQKFDPAVVEAFLRVLQKRNRLQRPAA